LKTVDKSNVLDGIDKQVDLENKVMSNENLSQTPTLPTGMPLPPEKTFPDRRMNSAGTAPGVERRQFTNNYSELAPETQELANAIDQYKLRHRRRFITYDEMLAVIKSLGYHK